jgi:hypothetical protein
VQQQQHAASSSQVLTWGMNDVYSVARVPAPAGVVQGVDTSHHGCCIDEWYLSSQGVLRRYRRRRRLSLRPHPLNVIIIIIIAGTSSKLYQLHRCISCTCARAAALPCWNEVQSEVRSQCALCCRAHGLTTLSSHSDLIFTMQFIDSMQRSNEPQCKDKV